MRDWVSVEVACPGLVEVAVWAKVEKQKNKPKINTAKKTEFNFFGILQVNCDNNKIVATTEQSTK